MAEKIPPPADPPSTEPPAENPTNSMQGGRRRGLSTAWMSHVKATMRANKGLKLKQVLKLAKKTYKKVAKRGGGVSGGLQPSPVTGGRRRGTRRSRRGGNFKLY